MINSRLLNKNAVIIGGSSGIGLEIARSFAQNGANIIISSRSKEKLESAKKKLIDSNIIAKAFIQSDVTSFDSVKKLLNSVIKKFQTIDIVICTAGIHLKVLAKDTTPKQWKKIIDTNLTGSFYVNSIFGTYMLKQSFGSIINIASLGSRVALSQTAAYNVSKAGVEMLTKSLACEWAEYNVRVNAILPGVFKTELNKLALSDPIRSKNILNHTPMKRFGKLNELTSAALFLASDESSFVTGTSIVVDGGFLAYAGF